MTSISRIRIALEASAARHVDQSVREFAEYLIALDDGLSDAEARAKVWKHDGLVGKAHPPTGFVTCICDVESGTVCAQHSVKAKAANTISVQSDPREMFAPSFFNLKVGDRNGDTTYERIAYGDDKAIERLKTEGFACHCGETHKSLGTAQKDEQHFACGYPATMTAYDDAFIRPFMFTLALPENTRPVDSWLFEQLKARVELAGFDFDALSINVVLGDERIVSYAWCIGQGEHAACGGNVPALGLLPPQVVEKFMEVLKPFVDTTDPGPNAILPIDTDEA